MYSKHLDSKNNGVLGALGALHLGAFLFGAVGSLLGFIFS
jgi:hypothetical protein